MIEVSYHHWFTYESLSREEGDVLDLAEKRVSKQIGDDEYRLDNANNKERRVKAVARVIEAFRLGTIQVTQEGGMDEICRACASLECEVKPSNHGSILMRYIRAWVRNE